MTIRPTTRTFCPKRPAVKMHPPADTVDPWPGPPIGLRSAAACAYSAPPPAPISPTRSCGLRHAATESSAALPTSRRQPSSSDRGPQAGPRGAGAAPIANLPPRLARRRRPTAPLGQPRGVSLRLLPGTSRGRLRSGMAKLIYVANVSLDGYIEDAHGSFEWTAPTDEVFTFITDLVRPVGTYLYGRRMYDTMALWETDPALAAQSELMADFANVWHAADKVVYSTTLDAVSTAKIRLELNFLPVAVRALMATHAIRRRSRRNRHVPEDPSPSSGPVQVRLDAQPNQCVTSCRGSWRWRVVLRCRCRRWRRP